MWRIRRTTRTTITDSGRQTAGRLSGDTVLVGRGGTLFLVAVFQTDWLVTGEERIGIDPPVAGGVPIRFRLLGPVQVETDDGPVVPGRRQERCLLAILLLECGRLVTMRRLCELLWDDAP